MSVQTDNKVDVEILAVIAAAVAVAVEGPHQILSAQAVVQPLDTPMFVVNPWSMEGRFQIFRSRQVR